jgi:hypothetical protein
VLQVIAGEKPLLVAARFALYRVGETSGSHGDEVEGECCLGCCTMQSDRKCMAFRRCLLPPSSGRQSSGLSGTSVGFCHGTLRRIPEDGQLTNGCRVPKIMCIVD